ncbi:hypothetical protein ES703_53452 [subsurface metagenome]
MEAPQFIKRIGLTAVAQIILSLRGLVTLPILTKLLGPSVYGIWTQILVTVHLLLPFVQLGIPFALVRFLSSKEKKEIGQGVITSLAIIFLTGTIAALAVYFLSDSIAINLLKEESAATLMRVASLLIILEALNATTLGTFRIFGQIKRYAFITILQTILEVGLISFSVLYGYNLIGVLVSLLVTRGLILLLMLYMIVSYAGLTSPDFSVLRPYLLYGLPLIPAAIFQFVISSGDRYVIGFFMGAASVGIYSAAYNIAHFILMFHNLIFYVLLPAIYSSYDRGLTGEAKNYLSSAWKYVPIILIKYFNIIIKTENIQCSSVPSY